MRKLFLLVFALAAVKISDAQFAQFEISSSQKLPFFIAVDNVLTGDQARSRHFIDSLPLGETHFWFITDSSYTRQDITLSFPETKKYVYELTLVGNKLGILPVTETRIDTVSSYPAPKQKSKTKVSPPMIITGKAMPGITLDSLFLLAAIQNYKGETGCSTPTSELIFEKEMKGLTVLMFEKSRLERAKKVLASTCLKTEQLARILDLFEFDDTKLSLTELAKGHIFDLDNLPLLEKNFTLKTSREKLKTLLKDF